MMPRFLSYALLSLLLAGCQEPADTLFTEVSTARSGVAFVNRLSESPDFNVIKYGYFYNGGGVAAGDLNNDGYPDLFFTGNLVDNQVYFNEGEGELSFRLAPDAGVSGGQGWHTGVSLVDINADGWLDIYVCRSAAQRSSLRSNLLFINNGDETFTESAAEYGLDDDAYSTQAAFFDYDRDGDLDAFVLNHSVQEYAGFNAAQASQKENFNPDYASKLFRNDNGKFIDVTRESGLVANVLSFGLGIATSDFNRDGWTDIYISNDYNEEDYLYLNQGDGTFRESVRESFAYTSLFSMGSETADFNNDGWVDLVTLDMLPEGNERIKLTSGDDNYQKFRALGENGFHRQFMRNMLQLNQGGKTPSFVEVGQQWGVSNTDWSWSVLAGDLDLDLDQDLVVTNGYARDYTNMEFLNYTVDVQTKARESGAVIDEMEVIANMPSIEVSNYAFRNEGGQGFANATNDWGLDRPGLSNGAVLADFDLDGDLDLVISNVNEAATIYRNNTSGQNFISVDFTEVEPALSIGATVFVHTTDTVQMREFFPVRGFQSSAYVPLIFGLGTTAMVDSMVINWTDGRQSTLKGLEANTRIQAVPADASLAKTELSYTQYAFDTLHFGHEADGKNDFSQQYLLPWMVSDPGPVMTASTDGKWLFAAGEDRLRMLKRIDDYFADTRQPRLRIEGTVGAAAFADVDGDGDEDLIIATMGYAGTAVSSPVRILLNNNGLFEPADDLLPTGLPYSSVSLSVLDMEGDGDPDLFIGSRLEAGRYPVSAPSVLLENYEGGKFRRSMGVDLGLITASLGADVDGDGDTDLIIAREFGTVALFRNQGSLKLENSVDLTTTGLWYSLAVADFSGDGNLSLIAGNMGTNNQLASLTDDGLTIYYDRFGASPTEVPILAYHQGGVSYPQAARDELFNVLPQLKKNFPDYTSYAEASIEDVFGTETLEGVERRSAKLLQTSIYHFGDAAGASPLPRMAQRSSVYAIATPDLDGDGDPDLLLGGNQSRNRVRIGDMMGNRLQRWINDGMGQWRYDGDMGIPGEIRTLLLLPGSDEILIGRRNEKALRIPLLSSLYFTEGQPR